MVIKMDIRPIIESEAQYQKDKKLYSSDEVFDMMMKTIEEKFNVQSNLQRWWS